VVVGGGAVAGGDLLLEPARVEAAARVLPPHRDRLRIVPAAFGDESGMLGAAVKAFDALDAA
jgi:glucokinase